MHIYHPIMVFHTFPIFSWNERYNLEAKHYNLCFCPTINLITDLNPTLWPKIIYSSTSCFLCDVPKHRSMQAWISYYMHACLFYKGDYLHYKTVLMLKYVAGWQLIPGTFLSCSFCLWLYLKAYSNANREIFQISMLLGGILQPSMGCMVASTEATELLFLYIQSSGKILWNFLVTQMQNNVFSWRHSNIQIYIFGMSLKIVALNISSP